MSWQDPTADKRPTQDHSVGGSEGWGEVEDKKTLATTCWGSGSFLNHSGQPFPHLYNGRAGQSEGLWKDARGLGFFQTIPKALSVRG